MHHIVRALLLAFVAGSAAIGFEEARRSISADEIRAHLAFLAQDDLAGRAPGSRGGDIAAQYVASQFQRIGLQPVDGSYFQDVPIVGVTTDPTTLSVAFELEESRLPASYPNDIVVWPGSPRSSVQLSGELVFVGYGIEAPAWGWDDFKGRDLNGKVLVFLVGDPPAPPEEPGLFDGRALTYYGRWTHKLEEAMRRGATGALIIHSAPAAGYGWDVIETSFTGEQFVAAEAEPNTLLLRGWVSSDLARRLFEAAGMDLDELYVRAARRDFRPISTGITVRSRMQSRGRTIGTRNVVGVLPGSHPERGEEVVVYTSHYDHLGVGSPDATGDSVYNGAYDNAGGVAVLLEVAEAFTRLEPRTDRTVLFLATTAEEAGLLGAQHYVRSPVFPLQQTVAALNVDGANLWGPTDDMVVLGAELSTLGDVAGDRAREMGLELVPDPAPENGAFFRSDHFPFARAGVPALFVEHGLTFRDRPEGWGTLMLEAYHRDRYHRPSDEYEPSADLDGAVQQGRLLFGIGYDIATSPNVPQWTDGVEYQNARERLIQ